MTNQVPPTFKGSFEEDVPAALQEDVITRIVEVAWDCTTDPDISIIDSERRNATNITFTGSIMIDGEAHYFHICDGDDNGTVIHAWNQDSDLTREAPDPYVLAPMPGRVMGVSGEIDAMDILERWDEAGRKDNPTGVRLADLPSKYAYDCFFGSPGQAKIFIDQAKEHGFTIIRQSEAIEIKAALLPQIWTVAIGDDAFEHDHQALELMEEATNPQTALGKEVAAALKSAFIKMAETGQWQHEPAEAAEALRPHGLCMVTRRAASLIRARHLAELYDFEDIPDFDRSLLPKNPIAELFQTLDPSLVKGTRVNPDLEARRLLSWTIGRAAISNERPDHEVLSDRLASYGKTLVVRPRPAMEPVEETSPWVCEN